MDFLNLKEKISNAKEIAEVKNGLILINEEISTSRHENLKDLYKLHLTSLIFVISTKIVPNWYELFTEKEKEKYFNRIFTDKFPVQVYFSTFILDSIFFN